MQKKIDLLIKESNIEAFLDFKHDFIWLVYLIILIYLIVYF
jgi:hypothetical protein